MTSLSKDFKERMLAPINALFKDALDDHGRSSAAGRTHSILDDPFRLMVGDADSPKKRKPKVKPGKVDEDALTEAMSELNRLIGMRGVKHSLLRLSNFARIESERRRLKLPSTGITFHSVFSGPPGTGKTTVARLLGRILYALGLLEKGHTIEASKSTLCGRYLGETPHLVRDAFERSEGGVLFVDEAHGLNSGQEDMYGHEAIDALVKHMEDRRDRVVVIVAGYPTEMRKFITSNPGLRSRFTRSVFFPDYSSEDLQNILKLMCRSKGFEVTDGFLLRSELLWQSLYRQGLTANANGRLVRTAFEFLLENQAVRLTGKTRTEPHELCQFVHQDWEGIETHIRENSHE